MPAIDDPRLCLPPGGSDQRLQVNCGVLALRKTPQADAQMVSQVLHGEVVRLHHESGEFALVQSQTDAYTGWALMEGLSAPVLDPTHRICVPRLHSYAAACIRAAPHFVLGIGACLTATDQHDSGYIKCRRAGWIRADLLAPMETRESDPATVARKFLGTPYLWGGRDCLGIDCSGLVQLAFGACGVRAPRDSDMQYAWFGDRIENWQEPGQLQRNDLIFWRGHVGIMLDAETLLHANAHHMAVASESLQQAIKRIGPLYGDPIGANRVQMPKSSGSPPAWLSL